jgi:hypothetical protein
MPRKSRVEWKGAFYDGMILYNERFETLKEGSDFKNDLDLFAASKQSVAEKMNFQVSPWRLGC